jgi:hypothetical protein
MKRENLACANYLWSVEISDDTVIKCSHESCVEVVNKSNYQKPPITVASARDNIINMDLKCDVKMYTGFIRLRIEITCALLQIR